MKSTTTFLINFFSIILLILLVNTSFAQKINSNWNEQLSSTYSEFQKCTDITDNVCKSFTGKSLNNVYAINDFYSKELGRNLFVDEIYDFVKNSKKWTLIGNAFNQEILNQAQVLSNEKKAVVAVLKNSENIGLHVALILPGELSISGSWGLKVPNSSSFFTGDPQKSFINKGLSYAFAKRQILDVVLYVRNY